MEQPTDIVSQCQNQNLKAKNLKKSRLVTFQTLKRLYTPASMAQTARAVGAAVL